MISPEHLYIAAATAPAVLLLGLAAWGFSRQRKQGIEPPPPPMPASEELDPIAVTALTAHANPMIVNPTSEQEISFAAYRADAIARDCEQRKAEGRERHPEYAAMRAEAMAYAWMLCRGGRWTEDHVRTLAERLKWQ